jgi:hypothetical protein
MIVVTGAAGRLGKRVAQRLTDEGFQIRDSTKVLCVTDVNRDSPFRWALNRAVGVYTCLWRSSTFSSSCVRYGVHHKHRAKYFWR